MPGQHGTILRHIDLAFNVGTVAGLTDRELVDRFMARRGPAAEAAFAALVRRHGPTVLCVCRGVLHNHHDAQDAFQATFLVLARKAGSLWVGDSLGPWLHGVACRVASTARAAAARRRAHESKAAGMTPTLVSDGTCDDVGPIIHEEIARLPERYRAPVVLCDLEGRTYEEAARVLGRPVGTIKSRLARGREHLRGRMIRRGVVPAAVAATGVLSADSARAVISTVSIDATSRMAAQFAAGYAATDVIPSAVLALTKGVLTMMFLSKLKLAAAVVVVGCSVFFASAMHSESSSSDAGQVASRAEPSQRDSAESTTPTPNRAISPVTSPPRPIDFDAPPPGSWEVVVRIKILKESSIGFNSGTIIRSTIDESLILTSAHQFTLEKPAPTGEFPYRIKVDLFDRMLEGARPAPAEYVQTVDGELVDSDFQRDVSLVRIRPGHRLSTSKIVSTQWAPTIGMKMLTLGCSDGRDPTAWNTIITNPRFRGSVPAGGLAMRRSNAKPRPNKGERAEGCSLATGIS